jgi:hypothetical protein
MIGRDRQRASSELSGQVALLQDDRRWRLRCLPSNRHFGKIHHG